MPTLEQLDAMLAAWGVWLRTAEPDRTRLQSVADLESLVDDEPVQSAHDVLTQDMTVIAERIERLITLLPVDYRRALVVKFHYRWSVEVAGDRFRAAGEKRSIGRRGFEQLLNMARGALCTLCAVYG